MIEVKNLVKSFEHKTVLHNVSTLFEAGKTNLIIGQSGSGKTILMKSIVGLITPESGEILYNGKDLLKMNRGEVKVLRSQIGMLFQGSALFDSLTVLENVMFPLQMFTTQSKMECRKRAEFCLDRVHLDGATHLLPSEISGGMQKRVAIARAIALNPRYLFCDEPNSGLDPSTSIVIDELIHDITKEYNITTIVNTHDMNSVMNIGENIVFLNKGKKEWVGSSREVFSANNETLNNFIFASDLFKAVREYVVTKHGDKIANP